MNYMVAMISPYDFSKCLQIDCGRLDGERFSKENGFAGYFETSAKTGAGEEGMYPLCLINKALAN